MPLHAATIHSNSSACKRMECFDARMRYPQETWPLQVESDRGFDLSSVTVESKTMW